MGSPFNGEAAMSPELKSTPAIAARASRYQRHAAKAPRRADWQDGSAWRGDRWRSEPDSSLRLQRADIERATGNQKQTNKVHHIRLWRRHRPSHKTSEALW